MYIRQWFTRQFTNLKLHAYICTPICIKVVNMFPVHLVVYTWIGDVNNLEEPL